MDMPRPTEAHQALGRIVGEWSGAERIHPSPWDPQGGDAHGVVSNKVSCDGFAVVQEYEQRRGGATNLRAHGVFTYDPNRDRYLLYWFDSSGMQAMSEFAGTFVDGVMKLETSGDFRSRATFDFSAEDRYRFLMEVSPDGVNWAPFMDGEYTRA